MEIVGIKCENCGREVFVQQEYIRGKMFCTLGCMDSYTKVPSKERMFF